jgi:hypothetical protein
MLFVQKYQRTGMSKRSVPSYVIDVDRLDYACTHAGGEAELKMETNEFA